MRVIGTTRNCGEQQRFHHVLRQMMRGHMLSHEVPRKRAIEEATLKRFGAPK
jgi:hypothetical protein